QLPSAHAQPFGQALDVARLAVERAFGDQRQRAAHRVGRAAPEGEVGRDLRSAAQAGPEARILRGGGRGKETAVLELGAARRADRPAIDAGRRHAHEHTAIEAGVVALEGAVVGAAVVEFHGPHIVTRGRLALAVFGPLHCVFSCTGDAIFRRLTTTRQTWSLPPMSEETAKVGWN